MANGKPKAAFYLVLLLVVAGLVWLGLHRYGGKEGGIGAIIHPSDKSGIEATDTSKITTAKEYTYVPAQRLPPVKGISNYKPLANRTVRMALNVWAGWAPVIYANGGFKAGKVWHTPGGQDFKVDLVLIDDPVAMRSEEHTSELQSRPHLVCRLLLEKKKKTL